MTVAAAERYLGSLFEGAEAPDTIVLGCTHFPVLAAAIRQVIGGDVAMVDSAETTAGAVAEALADKGMGNEAGGDALPCASSPPTCRSALRVSARSSWAAPSTPPMSS